MAAKKKPQKKPNRTAKDGRKGNGQFGAGNKFGGSAPFSKQKREERDLINELLAKAVPPKRLAAIADKMAQLAEDGNIEAAKFIFERRIGKATQPVDFGAGVGAVELMVHLAKD